MIHTRLIEWIEANTPLAMFPWERRFLRGVFSPGVTTAALSVGRGNGKSALLGAVGTAAVTPGSPIHVPGAETVIVASSLTQARMVLGDCFEFTGALEDPKTWRVQDSNSALAVTHRPTGAKVRAIGSDPKRAHGLRPLLIVGDEPSQWALGDGPKMHAALTTALGKVEGSRYCLIGTRPSDPVHFFQRALEGDDVSHYAQCHAADPGVEGTGGLKDWKAANPSWRYLPELRKIVTTEARKARKDGALLASFRALRLNLGTEDTDARDMLLDAEDWRLCLAREVPEREGAYVLGVDLGGVGAMSAACACWPNGRLETLAMIGREPSLSVRASQDGAGDAYALAQATGELVVAAARITPVSELLDAAGARWGKPGKLVLDRYRVAEVRDALDQAGTLGHWASVLTVVRGQGFVDGTADVRAFQAACKQGAIAPAEPNLLLTWAVGHAVTVSDPAGNAKLAKNTQGGRRSRARDDVVAAAILAVAHREAAGSPDLWIGEAA